MPSKPTFQIVGLPQESFARYFGASDAQLAQAGARRVVADKNPGFPCRVSLQDAEVGEELLLLSYEHLPANSPYRASGPIYVRRDASTRAVPPGVVPDYVRRRLMSVRAYDAADMMVDATVCEGSDVAPQLERMLDERRVEYIQLHNARPGCYSCRVIRAS